MEYLSPRQEEIHGKIASLLQEYSDVVGPVQGDVEDDCLGAEEMARRPHRKNAMLTEWVIVMGWTDLDDGNFFITKINLNGMRAHHQSALLRAWVRELES